MTDRTDNFNRADTASGIGTPSDGGSAWVQVAGTWGISSNQGYESSGADDAYCVLESSASDAEIQVTLATLPTDMAGLSARVADASNALLLWCSPSDFELAIREVVAGSSTTLSSAVDTPANGDVLKFKVNGSALEGYRNAVLIVSATSSAGLTETRHGLLSNGGSVDGRFDTSSITAIGGILPILMRQYRARHA